MEKCSNCGKNVDSKFKFCDICGNPLIKNKNSKNLSNTNCSNCGKSISIQSGFCNHCGTPTVKQEKIIEKDKKDFLKQPAGIIIALVGVCCVGIFVLGIIGIMSPDNLSENTIGEQQNPTQVVNVDGYRFEIPKNYTLIGKDKLLNSIVLTNFTDGKYALSIKLMYVKNGVNVVDNPPANTQKTSYNSRTGYLNIQENQTSFVFQHNKVVIIYTTNSSDYSAVFNNITFLS